MPAFRYAIYAAPRAGDRLADVGAALLGYYAESGAEVPQLVPDGLDPADWREITEEPRRYAFHGTLKAPFRLADGTTEEELLATAKAFAAAQPAMDVPLHLSRMGGRFLALVPVAPMPDLDKLADDAVEKFDRFRAPPNGAELARRLAAPLTERQRGHLERWGYPYVLEDFRYHMTLTGPLPPERIEAVEAALAATVRRELGQRPVLRLRSIAVFVQPAADVRFRLQADLPLGAG
jgi:putative phosphonate metabolism protein